MGRSAAAILLGLSAAVAACDGIAPAPVYGAPATGGSGGAVSTGGSGGETAMPAYGIPATGGGGN